MLKRIKNTVIGDVFCAKIDENHKRYLQYIVSDLTQLNSDDDSAQCVPPVPAQSVPPIPAKVYHFEREE